MKVNSEIVQNIGQVKNFETSTNPKAQEEKKSTSQELEKQVESGARVEISDASVEYARAAEMVEKVPEERAQKLADIQAQIENGTYKTDSTKVADKILDDDLSNTVES